MYGFWATISSRIFVHIQFYFLWSILIFDVFSIYGFLWMIKNVPTGRWLVIVCGFLDRLFGLVAKVSAWIFMGILDQVLEEEEAFLAFLRFPLLLAAQYFDRYCRLIRDLWILYGPLWCHQKNLLWTFSTNVWEKHSLHFQCFLYFWVAQCFDRYCRPIGDLWIPYDHLYSLENLSKIECSHKISKKI